ncbi:MAG: FAD-binding oxidoreductase [Actinobacteria bacterium]|nr:MAG: FAD-binding oxidoreductase [Actinomycetota bacterium]
METAQGETALATALGARIRGTAIGPEDPAYADARLVHNGMIDRRPALIARCRDAADVIQALAFARGEGLDVTVRCGAHSGSGQASVDGALQIDLTPIGYVHVDPVQRLARVGGGAMLGDVDHATHGFGLAAPFGTVSTTGVGGLTLGGGVGYLSRRWGLSIDNLVGADVVLADGTFVSASEDANSDLFWALRGGGGNFGIVTEFRFQLHPVGNVIGGPMLWPLDKTEQILSLYRDWMPEQPDDIYAFFAVLSVPPGDPFPAELHLRKACALVWCNTAPEAEAKEAMDTFRAVAPPMLDGTGEMPFPALQSAFDPLLPFGTRMYWRGGVVKEVPDAAIPEYERFGNSAPTWASQTHVYPIDAAASRPGVDSTAWPWRDARWSQVFVGVDYEPGRDDELRDWAVGFSEALRPYSMDAGYVNFMMDEGDDRVRGAYGPNYERLTQIKAKYDPDNVFHANHNIRPAS